jgi:adenosylhomocysteine nucleosidase
MVAMELRGTVRRDRPLLVVAMHEEAVHLDHDDVPVLVTGPGKVRAAAAVAALLATERPAYAVNLGTAGALRPGLDGVHEVGTVLQHDFDDDGLFELTGRHFGAPVVLGDGPVLATGDRFVSGGAVREALAARADLVDMEGYAVAAACRDAQVDVRLVKLVSDDAGEDAHRTWAESVGDHAETLARWVREHLL